ncbi:GNAT family N-acetyltransferase [Geminicoccaceae bacterium 1502E]|nr:GNAT family N-acetyltransferase [Geminicoccaceae bacterium 1502E]
MRRQPDVAGAGGGREAPAFPGAPEIRIALAHGSHVEALVALEQRIFAGDRLSRRSFRRLVGRPSAVFLVAEGEGALCGYALVLLRRGSRIARLYSLARDPAVAPPGTGRALLGAAEAAAREGGAAAMRLEVRMDNDAALQLYGKCGYRSLERLPSYYQDGADGVRMEKRLDGGDAA